MVINKGFENNVKLTKNYALWFGLLFLFIWLWLFYFQDSMLPDKGFLIILALWVWWLWLYLLYRYYLFIQIWDIKLKIDWKKFQYNSFINYQINLKIKKLKQERLLYINLRGYEPYYTYITSKNRRKRVKKYFKYDILEDKIDTISNTFKKFTKNYNWTLHIPSKKDIEKIIIKKVNSFDLYNEYKKNEKEFNNKITKEKFDIWSNKILSYLWIDNFASKIDSFNVEKIEYYKVQVILDDPNDWSFFETDITDEKKFFIIN